MNVVKGVVGWCVGAACVGGIAWLFSTGSAVGGVVGTVVFVAGVVGFVWFSNQADPYDRY